jgi:hypothetical protein
LPVESCARRRRFHRVAIAERFTSVSWRRSLMHHSCCVCADARDTVFFLHGVLDTSMGWVSTGVTGSQAFAAWDQGFDVWLGNSRSNPPRGHIGAHPPSQTWALPHVGFGWCYTPEEVHLVDGAIATHMCVFRLSALLHQRLSRTLLAMCPLRWTRCSSCPRRATSVLQLWTSKLACYDKQCIFYECF